MCCKCITGLNRPFSVLTHANVLIWNTATVHHTNDMNLHFYAICCKIDKQSAWMWQAKEKYPLLVLIYIRLIHLLMHLKRSLTLKWVCIKHRERRLVWASQSFFFFFFFCFHFGANHKWWMAWRFNDLVAERQVLKQAHYMLTAGRWRSTSARSLQHSHEKPPPQLKEWSAEKRDKGEGSPSTPLYKTTQTLPRDCSSHLLFLFFLFRNTH